MKPHSRHPPSVPALSDAHPQESFDGQNVIVHSSHDSMGGNYKIVYISMADKRTLKEFKRAASLPGSVRIHFLQYDEAQSASCTQGEQKKANLDLVLESVMDLLPLQLLSSGNQPTLRGPLL